MAKSNDTAGGQARVDHIDFSKAADPYAGLPDGGSKISLGEDGKPTSVDSEKFAANGSTTRVHEHLDDKGNPSFSQTRLEVSTARAVCAPMKVQTAPQQIKAPMGTTADLRKQIRTTASWIRAQNILPMVKQPAVNTRTAGNQQL